MPGPSLRPTAGASARAGWPRAFGWRGWLVLTAAICCLPIGATPEQYYLGYEPVPPPTRFFEHERNLEQARERQERFRKRVSIPNAVGEDVRLAAFAETANRKAMAAQNVSAATAPIRLSGQTLLLLGAIALTGILAVLKLAPDLVASINAELNPWASLKASASLEASVRAEDADFAEFTATFWTGPPLVSDAISSQEEEGSQKPPLAEFLAGVPRLLGELRQLVVAMAAAPNDLARRRVLADLRRELMGMKSQTGHPELLPVWQMVSALEGLVKQLTDKLNNVTPSTIRTVNEAVELLRNLCVPGLRRDLLSQPPLRLLAVDDDLISRNAVALALKRALSGPDLAETSEAALALAAQRAYDVIFLDVQMPGMDGFELCSQIHKTAANATTPAVFVTCHSDFEARAQATLSGGSDLIGKPFLSFEITVKALTLALRGRLAGRAEAIARHSRPEALPTPVAALATATPTTHLPAAGNPEPVRPVATLAEVPDFGKAANGLLENREQCVVPSEELISTELEANSGSQQMAHSTVTPDAFTQGFLQRAATQLGPLRELVQEVFHITDEQTRQTKLANLYVGVNGMLPKVGAAPRHPAARLGAAVEGLLKKLLESPKHCSASALLTVATALDLLQDLCEEGVRADLANHPPIHLLIVDDDPIGRRALSCALQMAFARPACVESGESALAVAVEQSFDVVFMDVQMPGMDGFTACLRLHETAANRHTPVVFVTAHSDFRSRSQASMSGGSDFVAKPFLTAEVTVKALALALRGRLQQARANHRVRPRAAEPTVKSVELVSVLA